MMLGCNSALAAAPALGAAFACGAMRALSTSAAALDSLSLGADVPLLVRLPSRPWGAAASLSKAEVQAAAGKAPPARISVVRDCFAAFDQPHRPLNQLLKPLGPSQLAAAASLASDPAARAVVDCYSLQGDRYALEAGPGAVATDLLDFLKAHRQRVALLPDVALPGLERATPVVGTTKGVRQSSNEVLMVAPTAFGFNEQAAQDNSFMHAAAKPGEGGNELTRQVLREFAGLHHALTQVAGVKVNLFEHSLAHGTPDACFPNNWFSTHPAGEAAGGVKQSTLVFYPMKCPNRAAERREDIIKVLRTKGYEQEYDMAVHEANKKYFEGTGVLVIDRINGVVYVDISERADRALAEEWTQRMGYKELVAFRSSDLRGKSVYHTNVMMAIGTGVAIVCADSVRDAKERQHLLSSLRRTHEVVEISLAQMDALCGNALELEDGRGLPVMAMSTQAYNAFTEDQRRTMRRHVASLVHAPIDTLERVGGGGVRCTLAEIF
ncbi:hypothetical protein HYH03_000657 [Edaphochlamys debaryana]|uniref:Amidinotransferase n=1 Tax=Edaphochlamys debaryana TaxID=47281 RepID=A0A835YG40_9CHLO|nr:hypothetical protein HYH03_000657 [Edaphochlamys debaryana]|eukprot:KAG2502170.1 hypothetical protein HYH03_000657 [Edaphochlamys debaryana]